MYARYVLMAPISLAFNLFVMVTAPIWAAWAALGNLYVLPGVFALVHTHDASIYGPIPKPNDVPVRFKTAVWWLWRNPGYGFDAYVLGFAHEGMTITYDSGPTAPFDKAHTASRFVLMRGADGRRYFSYRRDQMITRTRYAKIWIGWHWSAVDGKRHMLKVMFNPFRSVS